MIITEKDFLRQPCLSITEEEIPNLRELLEKELLASEKNGFPGIGLSAIQIGILKKFAIVRVPSSHGLIKLDLANAVVEKGYHLESFLDEGCLSFPDQKIKTLRYQEIIVSQNLIPPYRFVATGLLAVCCQHEIDHYQQKLMFDHEKK